MYIWCVCLCVCMCVYTKAMRTIYTYIYTIYMLPMWHKAIKIYNRACVVETIRDERLSTRSFATAQNFPESPKRTFGTRSGGEQKRQKRGKDGGRRTRMRLPVSARVRTPCRRPIALVFAENGRGWSRTATTRAVRRDGHEGASKREETRERRGPDAPCVGRYVPHFSQFRVPPSLSTTMRLDRSTRRVTVAGTRSLDVAASGRERRTRLQCRWQWGKPCSCVKRTAVPGLSYSGCQQLPRRDLSLRRRGTETHEARRREAARSRHGRCWRWWNRGLATKREHWTM